MDTTTNVGVEGFLHLIQRVFPEWRLNVEGSLLEDLRNRGVEDPNVLPGYYYRDDAILLQGAIERYVSHVVSRRYSKSRGDGKLEQTKDNCL